MGTITVILVINSSLGANVDDELPVFLQAQRVRSAGTVWAIVFIAITVALAVGMHIWAASHSYVDPKTGGAEWRPGAIGEFLGLSKPLSYHLFWDFAANVAMIIYFGVFFYTEYTDKGVFGHLKTRNGGRLLLSYILAGAFLILSTICSFRYAFGMTHSVLWQMSFLLLFAGFVCAGDYVVKVHHSVGMHRFQYELFVKFVDIPMITGFTIMLVTAVTESIFGGLDHDFAVFVSGATAFQVIAFNVMFAFLDRFPHRIFRGEKALLLNRDGEFSNGYSDFKTSWYDYWFGITR